MMSCFKWFKTNFNNCLNNCKDKCRNCYIHNCHIHNCRIHNCCSCCRPQNKHEIIHLSYHQSRFPETETNYKVPVTTQPSKDINTRNSQLVFENPLASPDKSDLPGELANNTEQKVAETQNEFEKIDIMETDLRPWYLDSSDEDMDDAIHLSGYVYAKSDNV